MLVSSTQSDCDFVDTIMFGASHGLIITGVLTDDIEGKLQRFSRPQDQWYYLHAETIDKKAQQHIETLPLKDYLFRYDRGAFWVGTYAFERFKTPFTRIARFILDPLLHTRKLYQALQASGASQEHILQDLTVPADKLVNLLEYIDESLGIYPLWLCPIKPAPRSLLLCNGLNSELAINVGVWGPRMRSYDEFITANKQIESKLTKLGGKKWLYAHTYYTQEQFWNIYDQPHYNKLRTTYNADTLPNIYDKIIVTKRHPVNTKQGIYKSVFGSSKLKVED
jgi:hypothetical protein